MGYTHMRESGFEQVTLWFKQCFEEWLSFAESELGTKIPEFPVEEINAFSADWFPSKPIYHDSF